MALATFADLLEAACNQPQPQRLLLVFATRELPEEAAPAHRASFERGEGGALVPALCVDKRPEEIGDFTGLKTEADRLGKPWDVLFVAALDGRYGLPADEAETDRALRKVVQQVRSGRISEFVTVDRHGDFIQLRA